MEQKINFRSVRGVGEVINSTFAFIKENFGNIFKTVFFIAGPFLLITAVFYGYMQAELISITSNIQTQGPGAINGLGANPIGQMFGQFAGVMTLLLVATFFYFSGIYEYIYLYVMEEKENIQTGDIWRGIKRDAWMFIKTLIGLIVVGFLMMFVISLLSIGIVAMLSILGEVGAVLGVFFTMGLMLYLLTPLLLVFNVRIFERLGFFNALGRCYMLVSKNWWKTFLVLLITFLIQFALTFLFAIPNWLVQIFQMHSLATSDYKMLFVVSNTLLIISSYLTGVISLIGMSIQYFNLVERKDATGLLQKIDSVGSQPAKQNNEETY